VEGCLRHRGAGNEAQARYDKPSSHSKGTFCRRRPCASIVPSAANLSALPSSRDSCRMFLSLSSRTSLLQSISVALDERSRPDSSRVHREFTL
jgi:hypothetical protein